MKELVDDIMGLVITLAVVGTCGLGLYLFVQFVKWSWQH